MPSSTNPILSSYRRFLIDIHIPDWDPTFLSEFSPDHLVDAVARANATVITVPANNHVGLNFWPSSVGRAHRAIGERDLLAEMLASARRAGLSSVVYYAISYVEWYWEQHPESRVVFPDGEARRLIISRASNADRFRVICHNDPDYREFAYTQVEELARGYDCDGFNIDMTMWPGPCYCRNCRDRFRAEEGAELPDTVDWTDPVWIAFSLRRAAWLAEFATELDARIGAIRPDATVVHQSGAYFSDWWIGPSMEMTEATDWLSADTYTSREGLSFALKLSNSVSTTKPAELINTWTWPAIFEHVVARTPDEMDAVASIAVAHDCALSVIDAVDPSGGIGDANYPAMAPIFERIRGLEPYLGGELLHDVEIYRSFTAAFDEEESGHTVRELKYPDERHEHWPSRTAHRPAAMYAGGSLQAAHIPFGVLSVRDLPTLDPSKTLLLCNVQLLDEGEVAAITGFVEAGGRLYVSGRTPIGSDGEFLLGHLLGVRPVGITTETVTYASPTETGVELFSPFTPTRPFTVHGRQQLVELAPYTDANVLATITLPYLRPGGERYASTLSDPPGLATDYPSVVERRHGAGTVVYSAGVIEGEEHSSQREVLVRIVRRLERRAPIVTGDAPRCVEFTAFRASDGSLVVHALNRQEGSEPVAVHGVVLDVALDGGVGAAGGSVRAVQSLPNLDALAWTSQNDRIRIELPAFRVHSVTRIEAN